MQASSASTKDASTAAPTLSGRRESTIQLLTSEIAQLLRAELPAFPQLATDWKLLFSLDQHGSSLSSLYTNCGKGSMPSKGHFLIIQTSNQVVLGSWISTGITAPKARKNNYSFSGNNECFVFSIDNGHLKIYRASGNNMYFLYPENAALYVGGGGSQYTIHLDKELQVVGSGYSPCFESPCLFNGLDDNSKASIVAVEVWEVGV